MQEPHTPTRFLRQTKASSWRQGLTDAGYMLSGSKACYEFDTAVWPGDFLALFGCEIVGLVRCCDFDVWCLKRECDYDIRYDTMRQLFVISHESLIFYLNIITLCFILQNTLVLTVIISGVSENCSKWKIQNHKATIHLDAKTALYVVG